MFLLGPLGVLFLLFLPWLAGRRGPLCRVVIQVYTYNLLQLEGLDCVLTFSQTGWCFWLGVGPQWCGGLKHQAAICVMGGNCSRCIVHFIPLLFLTA